MLWPLALFAQNNPFAAENDVVWHGLGTNEDSSMPIGNGDIAANVWTEQNGDIVILVAKADAWSENGQLMKLGRVRVKLAPNPFAAPADVTQTLKLESGEVELQAGHNTARIYVDANQPVVRFQLQTEMPVQLEAKGELWRAKSHHLSQREVSRAGFFELGNDPDGLTFGADTVLPVQDDCAAWCHFNSSSIYPLVFQREHLEALLPKYPDPLLHRCFGLAMKGPGLAPSDNLTVKTGQASEPIQLDIYGLTRQTDSPESWRTAMTETIALAGKPRLRSADTGGVHEVHNVRDASSAREAHLQWWRDFWNRSWIHITGTPDAAKVSQSYAIQRYMTACAGRGEQPIKFNGSLFTVGHDLPEGVTSSDKEHDPDFRAWGASYWNQNTRLVYWPLLASGDDDLLAPWFNMYVKALPLARDRTESYYHHGGGAFIETIYFWGLPNLNDYGWNNKGPELESQWMRYHIQGGLEVLAQMLDYYDNTQQADFAQQSLLPMADAVVTYYDEHWPRDPDGKIDMYPSQSIEIYQVNARNPTPDIAGLMCVLPRLLALPPSLGSETQRQLWAKVLKDLPPLPAGQTAHGKIPPLGKGDALGSPVILPAQSYGPPKNHENPELYTVFPYRLFGVGKPRLDYARGTFAARLNPFNKCWGQDGMEGAILGMSTEARNTVIREFTSYGGQRFPWFWSKNSDWIPDMDDGGAGMMTLQLMLMQCDGRRIQILPAWPQEWTADFMLHAPFQTTVEGHVEHGKFTVKTVPESRAKDVVAAGQ